VRGWHDKGRNLGVPAEGIDMILLSVADQWLFHDEFCLFSIAVLQKRTDNYSKYDKTENNDIPSSRREHKYEKLNPLLFSDLDKSS